MLIDSNAAVARQRQIRALAAAGALFALAGVVAGAFGAHAAKASLTVDRLAVFETAVRYQVMHALALFACAWALQTWPGRLIVAAGACFAAGIVLCFFDPKPDRAGESLQDEP